MGVPDGTGNGKHMNLSYSLETDSTGLLGSASKSLFKDKITKMGSKVLFIRIKQCVGYTDVLYNTSELLRYYDFTIYHKTL